MHKYNPPWEIMKVHPQHRWISLVPATPILVICAIVKEKQDINKWGRDKTYS